MKKLVALFIYLIIIAASKESGLKLSPSALDSSDPDAVLQQAHDHYFSSLEGFRNSIDAMIACAEEHSDVRGSCSDDYRQLRDAYKRLEVLLDYRDHSAVAVYLNSAPLLSLEPSVPEIVVLEPEGMQVLDESMYLDPDSPVDREEFVTLTRQLRERAKMVVGSEKASALRHHQVWNGMRLSLIRFFTLGLTGFDTPGSLCATRDGEVSIATLKTYYAMYSQLVSEKDAELDKRILSRLDQALSKLNASDDFNAFDRMDFLKEDLNPLFADLLRAQRLLGVALPRETDDDFPAIDLAVENLFDPALFNMDYYTNIEWDEVSDAKVELGKTLFFDPVLSSNLKMSCASCHRPELAFTDGQKRSISKNGETTVSRNSPTLVNCVYSEKFFLDLREEHLERQIKHVVMDSLEFDTDFLQIVERLGQSSEYKAMFAEAYPETKYQLSRWSVSDALAVYVASLTSFDSEVDRYIRGEKEEIAPEVYRGFNVFMGKGACGTCHFAPAFNGTVPPVYQHSESEVLGVPATTDTVNPVIDPDPGRVASSRPTDESHIYNHAFKTTTVRNVAVTAPYMHNGVYETLEEVIDFYNKGGGLGLGIDVPNQTLPDAALDLTAQEVSDLVAFMEALTDLKGKDDTPAKLPAFDGKPEWNDRSVGGRLTYN